MKERGLLIQRSPACGENLRHRRLRPGRSGSRLDVRATGHRPSPEGQILSVPKFGGEKGDEPRARGVSGDLVMFADATPPLSKRGGLQHPPMGEVSKPARGQGERGELLAQGQLRRNVDPGKHTAGLAAAPRLAHLLVQAALSFPASQPQF